MTLQMVRLLSARLHKVPREVLETIITERRAGKPPELEAVTDGAGLGRLFEAVDAIFLPKAVAAYVARLVDASHPTSELAPGHVRQYVRFGASPRAAIAIAESARAHALLDRKPNVGFDDVQAVAVPAVAHRLALDYRARLDGVSASDVVRSLVEAVSELDEGRSARVQRQLDG